MLSRSPRCPPQIHLPGTGPAREPLAFTAWRDNTGVAACYPLLISEIRKLNRRLPCIIEHIKAEPAEMTKTKAWVEGQLLRA